MISIRDNNGRQTGLKRKREYGRTRDALDLLETPECEKCTRRKRGGQPGNKNAVRAQIEAPNE